MTLKNVPTEYRIVYNWKIAGEAGAGIMNTGGPIFAKTLKRAGFYVFIYSEYPSLIRGGHNTQQVVVGREWVGGPYWKLNQLVVLNANALVWHQDELESGGTVLYDPEVVRFSNEAQRMVDTSRIPTLTGVYSVARARKETKFREDLTFLPVPFKKIAEEVGGNKLMQNVAAVGAAFAVFCEKILGKSDTEILPKGKAVLEEIFGRKGKEIVEANQKVLEAGYHAVP